MRHEVVVGGESFELYARDIIECIRALWADPEFLPYLVFEPERHYADDDHTIRMYHDMNTGKWWWATQVRKMSYTPSTVYEQFDFRKTWRNIPRKQELQSYLSFCPRIKHS